MVKFPCSLEDLPTPALLVDEDVVRRNCEKMLSKAAAAGVNLRPHMKTHKTVEIGLMQVEGSTVSGILVSTLAEARHFARVGFRDITYGVPISRSKMPVVDQICKELGADMTLFVDSNLQVDLLETFVSGGFSSRDRIPVFLKIDSGYHRAGIDIHTNREEAISLAVRLHDSDHITLRGIYSHSGHAYDGGAAAVNDKECTAAKEFADACRKAGAEIGIISVGGTPTCGSCDRFEGATEIHPGNYTFFDRQQMAVGACSEGDVAATVLTRILGHYKSSGHMLCDAGSLAMSKDKAPQDQSFGKVMGESLFLSSVSQEVGKLVGPDGVPPDYDAHHVGKLVRILPNHSCLTAALHPVYYMVKGETVVGMLQPCRGW